MKSVACALFVVISCILLPSCTRTPPEIQASIDRLTVQEKGIKQEIRNMEIASQAMKKSTDSLRDLREEVRALEVQKNGGDVEYILVMGLSQDRVGFGSVKDMMNATEFSINVDRKTYNHYQPGDEFFRKFREGSAVSGGSMSSWLIKVKSKRINFL